MTPTASEPDRSSIESYNRWVSLADEESLLREENHALVSNPSLRGEILATLTAQYGAPQSSFAGRIAVRLNRLNVRLSAFLEEVAQGLRPAQVSRGLAILGGAAAVDDEDQAVLDILEPAEEAGAVTLPSPVVDLLGRRATATWAPSEGEGRLIVNGVRPGYRGLLLVGFNRGGGKNAIVLAERTQPGQFVAVWPWADAGPPPRLAVLATAD